MTLAERLRSKCQSVKPLRQIPVHWLQASIRAKQRHLQEIRNDPFFGEDDREWMSAIKLEIRRLQAEFAKLSVVS